MIDSPGDRGDVGDPLPDVVGADGGLEEGTTVGGGGPRVAHCDAPSPPIWQFGHANRPVNRV